MRKFLKIFVLAFCMCFVSTAKLDTVAEIPVETNCSCVNLSLCNSAGIDPEVPCPNRAQVCCDEANIVLEGLPLDLPSLIESLPELPPIDENEANVSCICMPSENCIDLRKGTFSVTTRNQVCEEPGNICCSVEVSDDDFLTGIFGTSEVTSQPPTETVPPPLTPKPRGCRCVPVDECKEEELPDLLGLVHLRTRGGSRCGPQSTCCKEENIIQPVSPIEPTFTDSCLCVLPEECKEEASEISAIVHVRSSLRTTICSNPDAICCPKENLIKVNTTKHVAAIIPAVSCTCVSAINCLSENLEAGGCPDQGNICCPETDLFNIETIAVPKDPLCSCVHTTGCSNGDIGDGICDGANEVCCLKPRLSCGQSHETNSRIDLRIRGGFQAKFAEFPWMVALMFQMPDGSENYTCGGSLIHPQVVMTTAHCIDKNLELSMKIRAGDWDIESTSEKYPHQERFVSSRILHPKYSPRTLQYDIGILILEEPVSLDYHVNTICLPSVDHAPPRRACQVSGWGKDRFGDDGRLQTTLKKINVPLIDHAYCQKALRKTRLGPGFNLGSTFTCAGGVKDDACSGDGGSPLICPMADGSNRYIQMGAVAWGLECGNLDVPGVYASVDSVMPWIRNFMTKEFGPDSLNYFT